MRFRELEQFPNDWLGSLTHGELAANAFPLRTDRTQKDVDRVLFLARKTFELMTPEEKREFAAHMKGAYNSADLNRVGYMADYLSKLLLQYGYSARVQAKTEWMREDLPREGDMVLYLENIRALLQAYCARPDTPAIPTNDQFIDHSDYLQANAVEQNLLDMYDNIQLMVRSWFFSGEVHAGEI